MPKRRRLLALLIANVMAAALTTAYATTYEVTASVLNVRTGPGTVYAVKAKLVQGDTVEVKTLEGPWALISLGGEKEGYVSTGYLAKTADAQFAYDAGEEAVAVMATTGVLPDDLPAGTTQGMVMSNSRSSPNILE